MKELLLKVVPIDGVTRNGFRWPEQGEVTCPDWSPILECGNGLHCWRWLPGCEKSCASYYGVKNKWLVVEADSSTIIDLGGKVKIPGGRVIYCGDFEGATKLILAHRGPSVAGFDGTATAGNRGTATAGDDGTATAGFDGTATAGNHGTATAGDRGTATAGFDGTATAGDDGTATAGHDGTATAGHRGLISILYWDGNLDRYIRKFGAIGTNGLKPDTPYKLNDSQEFEEVL